MSTSSPVRSSQSDGHFDWDPNKVLKVEEEDLGQALSISSSEQTKTEDSVAFRPSKALHINSRGIGLIRLPLPSSELEILVHNEDGSLAYTSTRASRCSGNATLSEADSGRPLMTSEYRFGPGRDPKIQILNEQETPELVTVSGKWMSRDQTFTYGGSPARFKWRYHREKLSGGDGKKHSVLVMEIEDSNGENPRRVAQLARTDDTRTPGSSRASAGNGGVLMLDELALKLMGIPEELAVASALMMLKKEIDRRRAIQFAIIIGVASH